MLYTADKCRMCLRGKETTFYCKGPNARSVEGKSNVSAKYFSTRRRDSMPLSWRQSQSSVSLCMERMPAGIFF